MSKSHVENFQRLHRALLKDVVCYAPDLRPDLERDLSRIESSTVHMGIYVYVEFLPAIRKILDLALSTERLDSHCMPFMRTYKRKSKIPRLFKGFWSRLFTDDGCLKQDVDPTLLFFFRVFLDVGKKFEMAAPDSRLYAETREFYITDVSLPDPTLDWASQSDEGFGNPNLHLTSFNGDAPSLFPDDNDSSELLDTIQQVADVVSLDIGLPGRYPPRHGPGAVAESLRGIEKYSIERWSPRLESRFPYLGTLAPLSSSMDWQEAEISSRLLAVPKTITGPRLIACEPTDNLFCQFSFADWLYDRLGSTILRESIDLRDQVPSRRGALEASLDGRRATIDLKSASDRISLWLVERIFRKNLPLLLDVRACRTAVIDLSMDKKLPSLHRLKKFTTQGSALTFPIQSVVFAAITIGVGHFVTRTPVTYRSVRTLGRQVRVFGDDIIAPADWVPRLKAAFKLLHLKVNPNKTHSTGFFRESCGMDAYKGVDVTPPHVIRFGTRAGPSAAASVVACSNNFFTKGLWHAAAAIYSTLPHSVREFIPVRKVADGSIHLLSYSGNSVPKRKRWNQDLQREEYLSLVTKSRVKRIKVNGSHHLRAFLSHTAEAVHVPSFEGTKDWRPLSRWEAVPVEGYGWVSAIHL